MPAQAKTHVNLMFRAFSDPIRLRILNLLQDGELCVCDLVEVLELPQPTVSRHLAYLRRAGLVNVRSERSWNFYEMSPAKSTFHVKLLECLAASFADVPGLDRELTTCRGLRQQGGCCPD